MLQEHISSNRLVPVLLAHSAKESDYHLYALYSPSKYSNPKIRSFIDFLVEKFRYYAPWDERMKDHPLPSLIN